MHSSLSSLHALRTFFIGLKGSQRGGSGGGPYDQTAIYEQLLNSMIIERSVALELQKSVYSAVENILPELVELGNCNSSVTDALSTICASKDIAAFNDCLKYMSTLQIDLLATGSSQAQALARMLVQIETDYYTQILSAQKELSTNDTEEVSAAANTQSYDESSLQAFIERSFPDETTAKIVESGFISGGSSKFTISLKLENTNELPSDIILRGDAAGIYGGASVIGEHHLLKCLYEHDVNVAKPLALEETGDVFGSPFMLMDKRPGSIVGNPFNLPAHNPGLCVDVAENLAKIHKVPLSALGDGVDNATGKSSDIMLSWLDRAESDWKPLNMPSAVFETAFDWLRSNAELNDKVPRGLVHGDFAVHNFLVHEDKVSVILDWEFAHIGNPAYDFGYFYYMAEALGSWDMFLQAYKNSGGQVPDEQQLNYHILFATTRLGVMNAQTLSGFQSGDITGVIGAAVAGDRFHDQTILRISSALGNVL